MSELKAFDIVVAEEGYCEGIVTYRRAVYDKSEADKVIARHKYKRCLAMADMNWWQANRYSAAEMVERIRWNLEEATKCSKLDEKYLKRYHKWLALAEKFKEE